jgi:hypothetical protein
MKKIAILLLLTIKTFSANGDAIFFPIQYAVLCYSAEVIYSYEKAKKTKNTTNYWIGTGVVGSFYYLEIPVYGLEAAIETRHYFKSDKYKKFFISAYLGTAYMTDFNQISNFGLIPGLKTNYKIQLSSSLILEPYISLSLPITYDIKDKYVYPPFPVLTIGARFGISKLINMNKTTINKEDKL